MLTSACIVFASTVVAPAKTVKHLPPKTTRFPALEGRFLNMGYAFGINPRYHKPMEKQFGVPPGVLTERFVRLLAYHGFNTVEGRVTGALAKRYGMKMSVFRHYFDKRHKRPYEEGLKKWLAFIKPRATNDAILCWRVYDEPLGTRETISRLMRMNEDFFRVDPNHPVAIVSNGAYPKFSEIMDFYMGEVYDLIDPAKSGKEAMGSGRDLHPAAAVAKYVNAYTLWACSEGLYMPTATDARKMMYLVVANGGNGWVWYRASFFPPPWLYWDKGEKAVTFSHLRQSSISDHFDIVTPILREIGKVGRKVMPLGRLLVGSHYRAKHPFRIRSRAYTYMEYVREPETYLQINPLVTAPSCMLGVWDTGSAYVLIPFNHNIKRAETATIEWDRLPEGYRLYDLYDLVEIKTASSAHRVDLEPGGGRFLMVAPLEVFAEERARILLRKYNMAKLRVRIRLQEVRACGLLDLAEVDRLVKSAEENAKAKDADKAWRDIDRAERLIETRVKASPAFGQIQAALDETRKTLHWISQWFKRRAPILAVPYDGAELKMQGFQHPLGAGRPALEPIVKDLRKASANYYPLVIGLEKGTAKDPAPFEKLAGNLQDVRKRLEAWRTVEGPKQRVGFLAMGGDRYDRDAWNFAQLGLPESQILRLAGAGEFRTEDDREAKLADFDVLWIHYTEPFGDGFLDKAGKVPAPKALVADATLNALRDFLVRGKGIFASGHATQLVCRLGLESVQPNLVDVNRRGFLTKLIGGSQYTSMQRLGLRAVKSAREHPILKDLDPEALWLQSETLMRTVNRSSWQYPAIPKSGRVIGGFNAAIKPPPNNYHYDLVEFRAQKGGAFIACGLPFWDFSLDMSHRGGKYQNYRNMIRLMQNAVAYLASPEKAPMKAALTGPFCVVDLAKKENNPKLTWKVSSGSKAHEPFDLKRGLFMRWQTRKMPAWVEIDLGRTATIDKVSLFTCWSSVGYADVGRAVLKVADPSTGDFVDVEPPARFEGRGYLGATFSFKPVRTRKVRLEDLWGDAEEGKIPVGINNIMIYGRLK